MTNALGFSGFAPYASAPGRKWYPALSPGDGGGEDKIIGLLPHPEPLQEEGQEMKLDQVMRSLGEDQKGAIGALIVGVIIGVILVIWLIAKIIGGIF